MMRFVIGLMVLGAGVVPATAQSYRVGSPDGRIEVRVHTGERLTYDVLLRGEALMPGSTLSMDLGDLRPGIAPLVLATDVRTIDEWVDVPVPTKASRLRDHYHELRLEMEGDYAVVFRAYDNGVAYRFETALPDARVTVYGEEARFAFTADPQVYFPTEEGFFSHNERVFHRHRLRDLTTDSLASIPVLVEMANGVRIAIADADVEAYPGLWFSGTASDALTATFPPYPLEERRETDRNIPVARAADYIAVSGGTRAYPWRVIGIAERDADLIENALVYLLGSPSRIGDTSWIRPGKVAWDWYNWNNIYGVDFEAGVNTRTYQYYIDFASEHGLEYVILDEGWYVLGDILNVVPEIDVEELVAYGEERGVGIILWAIWKTLEDRHEEALDQFAAWGVKGIKVDFMQRDDQVLMEYFHRLARDAAERQLLLNFHGAIRTAGMGRTWPNALTTEGVLGLEQNKWSALSNPQHNVTIPFTRMWVGPMDYTPGSMLNAQRDAFRDIFARPMSMGTRVHQLAMYVIYESPMQMLADSPSNYLRESEMMEFLTPVPATWHETVALDGAIGEYVVVARRHGDEWYLGAMTNWDAREVEIDLAFLPEGTYRLVAFRDGVNAARFAGDWAREERVVTAADRVQVRMAPGGGFAGRLVRE
jgi:alpha-glucosidase